MQRVLITGGAGFLGQYLVEQLAGKYEIVICDLHPPRLTLCDLAEHCAAIHYQVDITKPETLTKPFTGVDIVFHLAGIVSFWRKHAKLLHDVNVTGTKNVLNAARDAGVKRVIPISSVAAVGYNNDANAPLTEEFEFNWKKVKTKHYMLSKHRAELEVQRAVAEGLDTVIVNPGLMWGPGDLTNSAKLIKRLAAGQIPACPPGGTNLVDVRDVAKALPNLITAGVSGERYILGGENLTFREIYDTIALALHVPAPQRTLAPWMKPFLSTAALLNELCRRQPPPLTSDHVQSAYLYRYFSSKKATRILDWKPEISFAQTIDDSIRWLRESNELSPPVIK